jgi:hypothetical protein
MEEKDSWVHFKEIEWNDPKFNKFNVDTRDFHCGYTWNEKQHPDWNTIKKYTHFFFTEDELKALIERYFIESGGDAEWRMMDLNYPDIRVTNWNLKYLRVWRTELGFLVCNSSDKAIPKSILSHPINQEYLHTH